MTTCAARRVIGLKRYAEIVEQTHGVGLRPGEDRVLQVQLHIADSAEHAIREARPGHDELTKLLWPNIIRRNPALASRPQFTLEERMAGKSWLVAQSWLSLDEKPLMVVFTADNFSETSAPDDISEMLIDKLITQTGGRLSEPARKRWRRKEATRHLASWQLSSHSRDVGGPTEAR